MFLDYVLMLCRCSARLSVAICMVSMMPLSQCRHKCRAGILLCFMCCIHLASGVWIPHRRGKQLFTDVFPAPPFWALIPDAVPASPGLMATLCKVPCHSVKCCWVGLYYTEYVWGGRQGYYLQSQGWLKRNENFGIGIKDIEHGASNVTACPTAPAGTL